MLNLGRMNEEKWNGKQEGEEESDHDLCRDMLALRDAVGDSLPAREDASQADRDELPFEVKLDSAPDDAQDGAQHNNKVCSPDAKAGTRDDRIANMISCGSSAVQHDDDCGEKIGKENHEQRVANGRSKSDE